MVFMSLRELRGSTTTLDSAIGRDGPVVVTSHGKPAYIMLGVDEDSFEQTLIDLRRIRAKRAVTRMQATSARLGNAQLSPAEINAEIIATREGR